MTVNWQEDARCKLNHEKILFSSVCLKKRKIARTFNCRNSRSFFLFETEHDELCVSRLRYGIIMQLPVLELPCTLLLLLLLGLLLKKVVGRTLCKWLANQESVYFLPFPSSSSAHPLEETNTIKNRNFQERIDVPPLKAEDESVVVNRA